MIRPPSRGAPALGDFERAMIEMLLIWAPYGGPPEEDCLPTFGMTLGQVRNRVIGLIEMAPQLRLKGEDCARLSRVAKHLGVDISPPALRRMAFRRRRIAPPNGEAQ